MNTPLLYSKRSFSRLLLLPASLTLFLSCHQSRKESKPQQDVPKPLQDNSSSIKVLSKRSSDDLLQSVYRDIVEKTPDLQKLEQNVEQFDESINDSTASFDDYDSKSKTYYSSADIHAGRISDSALREITKKLIANSLKNYTSSIAQHKELLAALGKNSITLNDYHEILKISKTLSVMEAYQQQNIPSTKPLAGINRQSEKIIKEVHAATKQ